MIKDVYAIDIRHLLGFENILENGNANLNRRFSLSHPHYNFAVSRKVDTVGLEEAIFHNYLTNSHNSWENGKLFRKIMRRWKLIYFQWLYKS